ncbi:hypothetical protein OBBRIDRAFT_234654 [Obba rivulosa]|uniref:F-box domain-containing protein n=1 Tax=Obba rivulosa TaxID=1052685 RepID=A0A8E2J703_9APHY|nr:hypothetical protein OBBRIDRAFT_234654 [Obba rivulosa]
MQSLGSNVDGCDPDSSIHCDALKDSKFSISNRLKLLDLPYEILLCIAFFLDVPDVLQFRSGFAVCGTTDEDRLCKHLMHLVCAA